jgi:DMSO/TMAO reductase YedYZ molybdopterin-dependent catalytic subunit
MPDPERFLVEHRRLTRRWFLRLGASAGAALALPPLLRGDDLTPECAKACAEALAKLEYLTPPDKFGDVSRGDPRPHSLPEAKRKEVGLTQETWRLEVVADTATDPATAKPVIDNPLTKEKGNALDWAGLMKLAEKHAVSFAKIMTCNNIGRPLGMGIWEGVPLREVIWLAKPKAHVRRVFYHGYHNDDPKQMFRSSLPIGRVLEDPLGLPPVILCYKLNGQWLTPTRGGPVRMLVPEAYGFKSVKWLQRVFISNLPGANDTYAEQDNDVESWLKTFAGFLSVPDKVKAGETAPATGYAQVGISGLTKVQTWVAPKGTAWPADDPHFSRAPWRDAEILGVPAKWGGGLPSDRLPEHLHGFDAKTQKPKQWPMLLAMAHWAAALPGLKPGEYILRCRSIDAKGIAQPMPRPFPKSGRVFIEEKTVVVG